MAFQFCSQKKINWNLKFRETQIEIRWKQLLMKKATERSKESIFHPIFWIFISDSNIFFAIKNVDQSQENSQVVFDIVNLLIFFCLNFLKEFLFEKSKTKNKRFLMIVYRNDWWFRDFWFINYSVENWVDVQIKLGLAKKKCQEITIESELDKKSAIMYEKTVTNFKFPIQTACNA